MANETNNPRPLTDAEKAARDAALAAANKPADTKVATPTVAPVTVDHKPADKAGAALFNEAEKLVKKLEAANPAGGLVTPTASKPAVLPDLTKTAPTVTPSPAKGKAGGSVVKVKKQLVGRPATPAKPAPKTNADKALANDAFVAGFNLAAWPKFIPAPTKADILAARALGVMQRPTTKNELALAYYLSNGAGKFNVYDVALALQAVCGGVNDHKMNVINQRGKPAGLIDVIKLAAVSQAGYGSTGRAQVTYQAVLTHKGRTIVTRAFEAMGLKLPKHLAGDAPSKPAGASKPVNAGNVPANT